MEDANVVEVEGFEGVEAIEAVEAVEGVVLVMVLVEGLVVLVNLEFFVFSALWLNLSPCRQ